MRKTKLLSKLLLFLLLILGGKTYSQTTLTLDDVDFDAVNGEITGYNATYTDIIIPESFTVNETVVPVTSIKYYVFQNKGLTSVSFPNSLTSIKFLAFGDNELTSVTLPPNLTELGKGAFKNNQITEINGEPSNGLFFGINEDGTTDSTKLVCFGGTATEIDFIPNTVTEIQSYAFAKCSLTSVVIPDGVVDLHDAAFQDNELTEIVLPNSVTKFWSDVFASNKLTSVKLSENMTYIGIRAFDDNLLTNIEIPEGVTYVSIGAFESNKLKSVTFPSTLTKVSYYAFKDNELETVTFPDGLTEIEFNAFSSNNLTELVIPATVKTIESSAFSSNQLMSVTFEPNSNIVSIASNVFAYNTELAGIEMPTHIDEKFVSYVDGNEAEYLPGESITDFTTSYRAKILKVLTPDDVTFYPETGTIGSYKGTATDIIIPESFNIDGVDYTIKQIAQYAFQRKNIQSVEFPATLEYIGNSAFYQNGLTELVIPEGCELGTSTFTYNNIKTVSIPSTMTEIPSSTFTYSALTDLVIPETVKKIGNSAFAHNDITALTLPEGLEEIGASAFYINDLTSVTIPSSVELVDRTAFSRNKLTEVNYTETTELGGGAFSSNAIVTVNGEASDALFYGLNEDGTIDYTTLTSYGGNLSTVDFLPNDILVIESSAFAHSGVSTVELPSNLTHINYGAFYQSGLRNVTLPNTIKYIGNSAFSYCSVKEIYFPKSIEYIGSRAFSYSQFTTAPFEDNSNLMYIGSNAFERNSYLDGPIVFPTSGLSGFINYYDREGTVYQAGTGFLDIEQTYFARTEKVITLDDIEFDAETGTIIKYNGLATDIIIPQIFTVDGVDVTVKAIGDEAFMTKNLFNVTLPNTVESIGNRAFYNNSFIEEVVLGKGLKLIGQQAFDNSVPDDGIVLPDNGEWHYSYNRTPGTVVTEITTSNDYYYYHVVHSVDFVGYTDIVKTQSIAHGSAASAPNIASTAGYTFTGWDTEFDSVITALTVKAIFEINTFTVTFEDWDGEILKEEVVEYESSATPPADPVRDGYIFDGWSGASLESITKDITVTAKYVPNSKTVIFADWDGSILKSQEVAFGDAATAPVGLTREGYTFTGWDKAFDEIIEDMTVTAEYSLNSYTVTFKDWDGGVLKTNEVEHGSSATAPASLTREGYTFIGWDKAFDEVIEDITVTAEYEINTYTVIFQDWDGSVLKSEEVESAASATAPTGLTREGYTFTGWDKAFDEVIEDMTVTAEYALNFYTVTFKDWDGEVIKTEEVEYNNSATAPNNPVREGYVFSGWDITFDNITEDISVTAEYLYNVFTVTLVDWNGDILEELFVEKNNSAIPTAEPTREGYTFTGWDVAIDNIVEDITATAQYTINVYIVKFADWEGELLKTEEVEFGGAATAPEDPSHHGYTFTGWDKAFDNITQNIVINSQYDINIYTVTFVDFDESVLKTEDVEYRADATAPEVSARIGYNFTGWDIEFENITEDITVTAQYAIQTNTVTFVDFEGTVLKTEEVEFNASATEPEVPERIGYTFTSWDIVFENIIEDATVTAEYIINTYTVTFVNFDGSVLKTEEVEYQSSATAPEDPKQEGYSFAGWDIAFDNIVEDITVTATYSAGIYTVAFVDWDGTELKTEEVEYNKSATAPVRPSRLGYMFIGWDVAFDVITDNITVTAVYEVYTFSVRFIDWDGSIIKREDVEYNSFATAPEAPVRAGYTFTGWDKEFDLISDDVIVTAVYEKAGETIIKYAVEEACGSFTYNDITFTESTVYEAAFKAKSGVDSIVNLTLTIYPEYNLTEEMEVVYGGSYQFGTQLLSETGEYTETLLSKNGCDSTVTLLFTVLDPLPVYTSIAETACGSFVYNDVTFTESTIYEATFIAKSGADSIVTLDLTINPEFELTDEMTVAYGGSYQFGSQLLTESGEYTETFISASGCDSTVTLAFTVAEPGTVFTEIVETACGSFIYNDVTFTESTVYEATFTAKSGADSIVTLDVTINPEYTLTDEMTVAYGESYQFGEQLLTASGEYTETFASVTGCDSTVTLAFTVSEPETVNTKITETACGSFVYNDVTFTESTVYEATYTAKSGADSIVTLTLTVNPEYAISYDMTVAYGETFQFGEQLLDASGEYTETFTSVTGCDSVVTLNFVVEAEPVFTISSSEENVSIDENTVNGSVVITIVSENTDVEEIIYSMIDESGAFTIDSETGEVTVLDASVLDYETIQSITFEVTAIAGDESAKETFTVTLNDVEDDVSINDGQINLSVYPTVVSETVTVNASGVEGTLSIVSKTGTIVYSSSFIDSEEVNMETFTSGSYIVNLTTKDATISKNIILKK